MIGFLQLSPSSSTTRAFPCSRRYPLIQSHTVFSPSLTLVKRRCILAKSTQEEQEEQRFTFTTKNTSPFIHDFVFDQQATTRRTSHLLLQISYTPLNNVTFICQKKIKCNFLKRAQASLFLLLPQSIFFNANKKPFNKPSILLCLSMWITPEFSISTTVFMCLRINSSSTTWVKQTDLQHCTTFLTK